MNTQHPPAGQNLTHAYNHDAMVVHGHHGHFEAHQQHQLGHPDLQHQHHYPQPGFAAPATDPFASHAHFAVPAVPNVAMEANRGSSQQPSMVRSDTTMTEAPLNDAEYATLMETLNGASGDAKQGRRGAREAALYHERGESETEVANFADIEDEGLDEERTFSDMLQTPSTSQATDSWIINNHQHASHAPPSHFGHDANLTEASRSSSTLSGASEIELVRADTLEANPVFVNPHNVSNHAEAVVVHQVQLAHGEFVSINGQWSDLMGDVTGDAGAAVAGAGGVMPPPTCAMPSLVHWPGEHDFRVSFLQLTQSAKNKAWDYSPDLNKLFIDMNKVVQIAFSAGNSPPEGLFVRALPVYGVNASVRDPVIRCPNHAALTDASNKDFPEEFRDHLIRVQHDGAIYDHDLDSGRLSVLVPFERPQRGTDYCSHLYKFMCLGSDVGGINRRPLKVIFTLESGPGQVLGRYNLDVRICSCPKRDRKQDEEKFLEDRNKVVGLATGLARSTSVFSKPSAKKKKTEVEEFVMVPVAKADFEKLNEFAEAAVIVRNPDRAKEIKEQRRKLLDMHNKKHLNYKPK